MPYCDDSHEARITCSSIGVSQKTTGDSTSSTTRGAFTERCQAQCRLCFVPSWMICFEFSVKCSLDTFLVLIVLATEVNRGQQNSASEKPSEEFEHSPKANKTPMVPDEPDTSLSMLGPNVFVYDNMCSGKSVPVALQRTNQPQSEKLQTALAAASI